MTRRAQNVTETRQRIVEATVALHETVGLVDASIAAIAAEAGVTRLTVYRHFPDLLGLYEACNAHWLSLREPPDPGAWAKIDDADERLRAGLADLYRFYRGGAQMLTLVYRDWHVIPQELQEQLQARDDGWRDLLLEPFGASGSARLRLRAVLGHAIAFPTWRSLCQDHGMSNEDAVDAMARLAAAVAQPTGTPDGTPAGATGAGSGTASAADMDSSTPGTTR